MIVGFEAKRIFSNYTGLGNYARTLIENLAEYYPDNIHPVLFTPKVKLNPRNEKVYSISKTIAPENKFLWRSYRQVNSWASNGLDLYHGLSGEIPIVPSHIKIPVIVTIHDLIYLQFPKMYRLPDRWIYDRKAYYAVNKSDRIIAISEATKNALTDYYKVPENKIEVIYQSAHSIFENFKPENAFDLKDYNLPSSFFLYVGAVNERKQLKLIFETLKTLPESDRLPVVVIGDGRKYLDEVKNYIKNERLDKFFIHLKNFDFNLFPSLYNKATALIYPSLFEGFGIPVIEAQWCGCPVITSNRSSMPEAAGNHSILIDPYSTESLRAAITDILRSPPDKLRNVARQGLNYVQKFHSKTISEDMMSLYKEMIQ